MTKFISDSKWDNGMDILITKLSPPGSKQSKGYEGNKSTGIEILNLVRKLISIIIIFISFLYLFFRKDVIQRMLFTDAYAPVQELFFPSFLLITGIFILIYKIK